MHRTEHYRENVPHYRNTILVQAKRKVWVRGSREENGEGGAARSGKGTQLKDWCVLRQKYLHAGGWNWSRNSE